MQFPKDILNWIEAHHGLASWVEAAGVIGGIWVTQHIASREQRARRQAAASYKKLLISSFENLAEPLGYLETLGIVAPAHDPALAVQGSAQETAKQMAAAMRRMQDAHALIREIEDIRRIEDFDAVAALLKARRAIDEAQPVFQKELAWLDRHGNSSDVVSNAVMTISGLSSDLFVAANAAIGALKRSMKV